LLSSGAPERELRWLNDNFCRPDLIGFNYYLTSQRFLHEKLSLYPAHLHGGNSRHRYADIELVRVRADGMVPLKELLLDAWQRFAIPIAITECHNGCSREEQLRWLQHVWRSVRQALKRGVDVRAITAWSVFGATDWNTLLTEERGHYEPGVYDVRSPYPRPTALVGAWQRLGEGARLSHPILQVPGWWARPDRFVHGFSVQPFGAVTRTKPAPAINEQYPEVRPILITGARGTLGRGLAHECEIRAIPYRLLTRLEMDIADANSVAAAFAKHRPWVVLNAAGYVRVDEAERDPRCWRENAAGPEVLARACAQAGARLVTFSSDLVFDGKSSVPYVESDTVAPLNEYGASKAAAERSVLAVLPEALVVRTSAFFSSIDDYNFVTLALRTLGQGLPFAALTDCTVSPTFVPDLVRETLDLLVDGECGIWHMANRGETTWYELAQRAAAMAGVSTANLYGVTLAEANWPASRPHYSVLGSERGWIMPPLEQALARYIQLCDWLAERIAA
jgi:dTDP-4-dehydrorhamnose reductase